VDESGRKAGSLKALSVSFEMELGMMWKSRFLAIPLLPVFPSFSDSILRLAFA